MLEVYQETSLPHIVVSDNPRSRAASTDGPGGGPSTSPTREEEGKNSNRFRISLQDV